MIFAELHDHSTNNNRVQSTKRELGRQSPIIINRCRPTIENISSLQNGSDNAKISGNQIPLIMPSNFTFRNRLSSQFLSHKASLRVNDRVFPSQTKSLNYSKTFSENILKHNTFNPKLVHQNNYLPIHRWTPTFREQGSIQSRKLGDILRSKSQLSKSLKKHSYHLLQSERINSNLKTGNIQDLYISPRPLGTPHPELEVDNKQRKTKLFIDECKSVNNTFLNDLNFIS